MVSDISELPENELLTGETEFEIRGYLRWRDGAGTLHPARGVSVGIYNVSGASTSLLGYSLTDASGYFSKSFAYDGTSKNVFVKFFASGSGCVVKETSSDNTYSYTTSTYSGIVGGKSTTITYFANNDTDFGKSLSIHQAIEMAQRYVSGLDNSFVSSVDVSFPILGTSSYFKSSDNTISIATTDPFDWDTIQHEYGHYIQYRYGFLGPGATHYYDANMADRLSDKSKGIKLAWTEGWATYFAINLQMKMNASALNIPNVGDSAYQDDEGSYIIEFDIETPLAEYKLGEANEVSVAAILFDITDGINTSSGENDYISCADIDIWNLTISNKPTSLSDFINAFNNSTFSQQVKLGLGSILSNYKVAARLDASPSGLSTDTPTFTWTKQGGSNLYPNNYFRLTFFDSSYNLILSTCYSNVDNFTLTASAWNLIRNTGSTIYCCVYVSQTSTPQTGWYQSNLITINPPTSGTYKITNVGAGKCLNIYGSNVTSIRNHQNVCLWSDSGTNEQKWHITGIQQGAFIKSIVDLNYGLNVYRTGSPWNCDMYPIAGNETDSAVDFVQTTGGYKIKLHNYDLYLTAASSADGANVYWAASADSSYQVWRLDRV